MTTPARTAAFFDLDKTIIATSSATTFSREFFDEGLLRRTDAIRAAYAQFLFMVGGADERQTERLRDAMSDVVTGWDVAKVRKIVGETVKEQIDPVVYEEALALIRRHQANGRDVVIVSASGMEVVAPIAELLGADHAIGSQMEIKDGKYTGEISLYAFGPAKAAAMRSLASDKGYDLERCYAYSDSITDGPMLNVVGHGFAVNPDRGMRKTAAEHGWGVLHFRKPVALRESARRRNMAAGFLAAAMAVGMGWWVLTRRRRHPREG